tara:strand:- start:50 stop:550 length:501 start_codon:yes stop_codon:yes gene_type:complete
MADRFPLIVDSSTQRIKEIAAGDNIDLTGSGLVNAVHVQSTGTTVGVSTVTTANITALDVDGAYTSSVSAVAALDIDLSASNYFTKTIAGDSEFTFSNPPASGTVGSFTLEVNYTSGNITWPNTVYWNAAGQTAPTITEGKVQLYMFVTRDGGTTYRGALLADYDS